MFGEICLISLTLFSSIYGGIDADYYYDSGLRTQNLKCKSRLKQAQCHIDCGTKSALCIQDQCYCISIINANQKKTEPKSLHHSMANQEQEEHEDTDQELAYIEESISVPHIDLASLYALRPTVRHHIAHFCPNLDIARDCIRKCMKSGKPAFCGKDHVCYCGHKYENTVQGQDGDVKEIYAQFKDLYAKYFRPKFKPQTLK